MYQEYLRDIEKSTILLCLSSSWRHWRYQEYLRNIENTTILYMISMFIIFQVLEVAGILLKHRKYINITVFFIILEVLEVPGIPPER